MVKRLMKRALIRSRLPLWTLRNLLHNKRSRIRRRDRIPLSRISSLKWFLTSTLNTLSISSSRLVLPIQMQKPLREI
jgi:hypothetical protein